ncbi:MAG: hypothetical protein FWF53_11590 [Candidatus Azobacteroides sp.]|nr:hypothetical protein [Candidatus Azobacteroides sp.]
METKLTEQESLAIINEMIIQARNNVQKGSANSLVYNGYAVAFTAILNFILLNVLPESELNWSFSVWWLMIPSFFVSRYIQSRIDRSAIVKTHIDSIVSTLWRGFSISIVLLLSILFSMALVHHTWYYFAVFTPIIMIIVALTEYGMAKVYRFKPFFWGAVGFWTGALLCCFFTYFVLKRGDVQFLILALCMILGFVVPGYQLNKLAKEENV